MAARVAAEETVLTAAQSRLAGSAAKANAAAFLCGQGALLIILLVAVMAASSRCAAGRCRIPGGGGVRGGCRAAARRCSARQCRRRGGARAGDGDGASRLCRPGKAAGTAGGERTEIPRRAFPLERGSGRGFRRPHAGYSCRGADRGAGAERVREIDARGAGAASDGTASRRHPARRHRHRHARGGRTAPARGLSRAGDAICSTIPSGGMCCWGGQAPRSANCGMRSTAPRWAIWCAACRKGWIRGWAKAVRAFRAGRGGGWRWRACCSRRRLF